jgi:uncharacterized protein with HEPN domain
MSTRQDREYLQDILDSIQRIKSYTLEHSFDQFLQDFKTQDAVLRNIQVLGEAVKNLSPSLRDTYPDLPWKEMAGMRDRIVHRYFGIDFDIVWKVAKDELPALLSRLQKIEFSEEN